MIKRNFWMIIGVTCLLMVSSGLGETILANGSFEGEGNQIPNWDLGLKFAHIVNDPVHNGKNALLIDDNSENSGSSVYSEFFPLKESKTYTLSGWVNPLDGEGLGVYVRFYDANRRPIKTKEINWKMPTEKQWQCFEFVFEIPQNTSYGRIWVHSYNASQVRAVIDDLTLTQGGEILPETGKVVNPYQQISLATIRFSHPRLIFKPQRLPEIKAKIAQFPWAKQSYQSLISNADKFLRNPWEIPDRGGQWSHWYACSKDGTRLVADTPTQHRCPTCSRIYIGEPYDSSYISIIHDRLAKSAELLAAAYLLTSKKTYGQEVVKILDGYSRKYPTYPLHDKYGKPTKLGGKTGCQTLDEAGWILPLARAYDAIRLESFIDQKTRRRIETQLFREAAAVIIAHDEQISNRQSWSNAALVAIGFAIEEKEYLEIALNSSRGFMSQIANGILDGFWWEGSWGYHFFALKPLFSLAQMMQEYDVDLFSHKLKTMLDAPLLNSQPDLNLPGFHDSEANNLSGYKELYEIGYAHYGDARYLNVLSYQNAQRRQPGINVLLYGVAILPDNAPLPLESSNFATAGYAILRSTGKNANNYFAIDYGPHGGGHGHADKLGFVFYSANKLWFYDPGSVQYGLPENNDWFKRSLAHNAMIVERRNQLTTTGKSTFFFGSPELSLIETDAGRPYPGTQMQRIAILSADRLYLLDKINLPARQAVDWVFRSAGNLILKTDLKPYSFAENRDLAYKYSTNWRTGSIVGETVMGWEQDNLKLWASFNPTNSGVLYIGNGFGRNMKQRQDFPMLSFNTQQQQLFSAFSVSEKPLNVINLNPTNTNGTGFTINFAGGYETLIYNSKKQTPFGELRYQGKLALIRNDHETIQRILIEGSYFEDNTLEVTALESVQLLIQSTKQNPEQLLLHNPGKAPVSFQLSLKPRLKSVQYQLNPGEKIQIKTDN